jgi:hypothetical protein
LRLRSQVGYRLSDGANDLDLDDGARNLFPRGA